MGYVKKAKPKLSIQMLPFVPLKKSNFCHFAKISKNIFWSRPVHSQDIDYKNFKKHHILLALNYLKNVIPF